MLDDAELLHRYSAEGSEEAFRELVRRHLNLVYGAALRRTNGDVHRAEDVAQVVFCELARKAQVLSRHRALAAWLYATTRNVAIKVMLSEKRRQAREAEVTLAAEPSADWEKVKPILDGAMDELGGPDREVILLRFFEGRPFNEVSAVLQVSDDAARMRVGRALDKLRGLLARRGVTSSAAALAALIAEHVATKAPGGLADGVSDAALSGGGAVGVEAVAALGGKLALGGILAAVVIGVGWLTLASRKPVVSTSAPAGATVAAASAAPRTTGNAGPASSAGPANEFEPARTLAEILAEKDQIRAFAFYARRVERLQPGEFEAEFGNLIGLIKPEQRENFLGLLLNRWGRLDPLGGIAAVSRLPVQAGLNLSSADPLRFKTAILRGWIVEHPQDAWDWAISNAFDLDGVVEWRMRNTPFPTPRGGSPLSREEQSKQIREMLQKSRLAEMLPALPETQKYDVIAGLLARTPTDIVGSLIRPLTVAWAARDLAGAARWIQNDLPQGTQRTDGISGFLETVAAENAQAAASFFQTLSNPAEVRSGAVAMTKGFLAHSDRTGAAGWLGSAVGENEAGTFDDAIRSAMAIPAASAPTPEATALEFGLIAKIKDPAVQRAAVGQYTYIMLSTAPREAIAAAQRFLPPADLWKGASTSGSMGSLLTRWASNNHDEARAYANGLVGLTPEQATLVEESLASGKRMADSDR